MRAIVTLTALFALFIGCAKSPDTVPSALNAGQITRTAAKSQSKESSDERAPNFDNLIGVDDQKHALEDYAKAKAVVIVFTCNHCPVAEAYEDRLVKLDKDYRPKDVQFVAINVNNLDADKLPKMKERAKEKGFEFPYLYDPTQKVGRDYGALVTPHAFVLDGKRRIVYQGLIDDNMDETRVSQQYLRDAIDAALAGKAPQTTETKPSGCGIQYK